MLYSVLNLHPESTIWWLEFLLAITFCLDYIYLFAVIGEGDNILHNSIGKTFIDFIISIIFGIVFYQFEGNKIDLAFLLLFLNASLMLIYTLFSDCKNNDKVKGFCLLSVVLLGQFFYAHHVFETYADFKDRICYDLIIIGLLVVIIYSSIIIRLLNVKK